GVLGEVVVDRGIGAARVADARVLARVLHPDGAADDDGDEDEGDPAPDRCLAMTGAPVAGPRGERALVHAGKGRAGAWLREWSGQASGGGRQPHRAGPVSCTGAPARYRRAMRDYRPQSEKTSVEKLLQALAQTPLGGKRFITVFPAIDRRLMPLTRGRMSTGLG